MARPPSRDQPESADQVFASWLARRRSPDVETFEALLGAHPQYERELRDIHLHWARVEPLLRLSGLEPSLSVSFAERLRAAHGEGIDPEVSLDAPRAEDGKGTSELLSRLGRKTSGSRYTLEGEIARGGMGAILKVWDEDLRRHLAMKVVLGRGVGTSTDATPAVDERELARFLEEAQVTGQLDHPGIVPVHELGLDQDGRVYFTMKLVKGRDLKQIFDLVFHGREGWNETRALSDLLKVCQAMAYAHAKGVIHRDLKPANVMVGNFGEVFVMDWGLARVQGRHDGHDIRIRPEFPTSVQSVKTERRDEREELSDSPIVTMDGDVMGTPAYMAPEQARGEIEKLGPRSDVYSVGAMLYHLLTRRAPYTLPSTRVSNRTVLAMVLQGPPQALTSLRPDVPAELVAITDKAMAREASERYADTLALAEDLRAFLEHRVVAAYETGAWAEARKWVERNKPLAAALTGGALILIGGIVFSTLKTQEAEAARVETAQKNIVLGQTVAALDQSNAALTEQRNRADDEAEKAKGAALEASRQERIAQDNLEDVLSLSAIQELKELVERADALWPAFPEKLTEYDRWLADAKVLIEGSAADSARGIAAHPSSRDHESKLTEIRQRAKPLTPEQMEKDRSASPSFAEWEQARGKLSWMRRMLGDEPWPSEAEVEAALAQETLPAEANGLSSLAWPLVDTDPAKIVYGSEIKALILARRAVAAAQDAERAGIRDTLGWALYRCGRGDEALVEEQRAVDEAQGRQKEELAASLKKLQAEVALWTKDDARAKQADEESKLSARVADLERDVGERRTFKFEDAQDRWWHAQLSKLVVDLKGFTDEQTGGLFSSGISEQNGWGILKRVEFARTIGERSVDGPEASRLWLEAIAAIASSPKYGGSKLAPQLGLLPIGADPASGLWEFAHLQTGEPAIRGADGKLLLTEETGLVFVLIPSGTFWMGAQKTDENGQNYDPQARANESPVHAVTLSAYLLSKYEMTQGQWLRIAARNPSNYGPSSKFNNHQHDLTHPVEQVTWTGSMALMERLGLLLPSEAQWEFGCRGGMATPWWTGAERESLRGKVNLADQTAKKGGAPWSDINEWPDLEDGWVAHAPVGSLAANPYGLHEVHGNMWEWCRDAYDNYPAAKQLDPVKPWSGASDRVYRGGGFSSAASYARSAGRSSLTPEDQGINLGLRPARAITP